MNPEKVVLHRRRDPFADQWLGHFNAGIGGKGTLTDDVILQGTEAVVFWGVAQTAEIDQYVEARIPTIFIEFGYLTDPMRYASIGWGGTNGFADFRSAGSPPDRWKESHAGLMKPWRTGGRRVLIFGQPDDVHQPVRDLDLRSWYERVAETAADLGVAACYRPHPRASLVEIPKGATFVGEGSFDDCLVDIACAVTHSSNAGIGAVLAGVPVVSFHKAAMTWAVSSHSLADLANPARPDRSQWACDLAYSQWTEDEFRSGEVWRHLTDEGRRGKTYADITD